MIVEDECIPVGTDALAMQKEKNVKEFAGDKTIL